jgi:hypothetical protein
MEETWKHFNLKFYNRQIDAIEVADREIKREIETVAPESYAFPIGYSGGFYIGEPIKIEKDLEGLDVSEYEQHENSHYFKYFFAFAYDRISVGIELWYGPQGPRLDRNLFLQFHLEKSFHNNKAEYKRFLTDCQTQIKNDTSFLNLWIEDELKISTEQGCNEDFKGLFIRPELYDHLINQFSTIDGGKWFDSKGNFIRTGRDNVSAAITLFDLLISRHYFKPIDWRTELKAEAILRCWNVSIGLNSSNWRGHSSKFFNILSPIIKLQS